MSSTVTENINTSDSDDNVKLMEKRRKQRERSLRYYHNHREEIVQKLKERLQEDEEFRKKRKETNDKHRPKYKERAKEYNKMYYEQNKAMLMIFNRLQNDLELLKSQVAISSH